MLKLIYKYEGIILLTALLLTICIIIIPMPVLLQALATIIAGIFIIAIFWYRAYRGNHPTDFWEVVPINRDFLPKPSLEAILAIENKYNEKAIKIHYTAPDHSDDYYWNYQEGYYSCLLESGSIVSIQE